MSRPLPPALAGKLAKLGVRSRFDLLWHLPLRYEDETRLTPLEHVQPGVPALVEAPVRRVEVAFRPKRQLVVHAEGLVLRFLHFYGSQQKGFERAAREGLAVRAYGEVRPGWFGAEMVHPRCRLVAPGEPLPAALTPVYPATAGLSQAALRKLVAEALAEERFEDTLPPALLERHALAPLEESVRLLHAPPPGASLDAAWRRVKFDELLAQQLHKRLLYLRRRERPAPALPAEGPLLRRFLGSLPFRLTRAQRRVMAEILKDLGQPHPMQRLLQGDVGSGKTIVAAIACLVAVDAGAQAAVMAPTEVLAEQHYRKFSAWLAPLGVTIAWLHGGLPAAERKRARAAIAKGEAGIAIGTQALFQEGVEFRRLALAIVDEQHRFGVKQRLELRRKSEQAAAHQLMMSATPIPRTLAMTYDADLDPSVIDELPPGRKPVATRLASAARRGEVLGRIRAACEEGQQAYWVCPVIEESKEDLQPALDAYEELRAELPGLAVGLVHGRMPSAEKAAAMQAFAQGATQLLVCTTVIEVGVDVPNASLMVIEHAERFGLAQLHQLRGRVGRGAHASACILLFQEPLSAGARARLKVIYENADGFAIAEADLLLRGPGELLGERQSGEAPLRFADPALDEPLVEAARAPSSTGSRLARMTWDAIERRLDAYERLLRLDKPIGTLLLLWPTLWALWLAVGALPPPELVAIFCVGTLLMRSAGCAVNDYFDRGFDAHVERTRDRPLAAREIRPGEALLLAALLAAAAFGLVLMLNRFALALSFAGLAIAVTYPLTKRFFALPQLYLGVAFGFGIPMAYAAVRNALPAECWVLLAANICYAFAYDTEYAMVDRDDDRRIGMRTSAITLGRFDVAGVMLAYAGMLALLAGVGVMARLGWPFYAGLAAAAAMMGYHYVLIRGRSRAGCFKAFRHNNWVGAAVFAGIAAHYGLG